MPANVAACGTAGIKVVLVWADVGGNTKDATAPQLVDDLDLSVEVKAGSLSKSPQPAAGSTRTVYPAGRLAPDRANNVEKVVVRSDVASAAGVGVGGSVTIKVTAAFIDPAGAAAAGGAVAFALVILAGPDDPIPACATDVCGTGANDLEAARQMEWTSRGTSPEIPLAVRESFASQPPAETCHYTTRNECVTTPTAPTGQCAWCQWLTGARCMVRREESMCCNIIFSVATHIHAEK